MFLGLNKKQTVGFLKEQKVFTGKKAIPGILVTPAGHLPAFSENNLINLIFKSLNFN
jgi:hypothetical protein